MSRTDALKLKERDQRVLLEINRAVSVHLDRDGLFQTVSDVVRSVVSFDHMAIVLPRPRERDLLLYTVVKAHGEKPYWRQGTTFPRAGTVVNWVLKHKQPFVGSSLEDLRPFPVSLNVVAKEELQSFCALPLVVKDRPMSVLVFLGKEQHQFDSANLVLLEEMAGAIAVALDHCLAYEEIKHLKDRLDRENIYLQEEIKTDHNFEEIIGQSRAIKDVLRSVEMVAGTDSSVLISGETGTGKELIARAIHHLSPRASRPLIKVNCAGLPAGLIESELFGHERGAFTGAITRRIGRFELADEGTIFLDEVGDLPQEVQIKLLRVLQEREFERVGGTQTIKVDVRVIAATNRDLGKAVSEQDFRADLYYRLNIFPIVLPTLRERREDVPSLIQYVADKYRIKLGKRIGKISQKTMRRLMDYPWPGNIRELENVIERAMIVSRGSTLVIENGLLPSSPVLDQQDKVPLALEEVERDHIVKTLDKTRWVIEGPKGAATLLRLHPNTLRSRMKRLGIKRYSHDIS